MYIRSMRTTINLDPDVTAALETLRRERGLGISEAVNELARRGLAASRTRTSTAFVQRTQALGLRTNIDNTAEVLELLDDFDRNP
jgi:Arc/MetJ family transcription regulator